MAITRKKVARLLALIVCGLAGFILGTNYGCSFLLLLKEKSLCSNPSPADPSSSGDLAAETAQVTRSQRAFALQTCCAGYTPRISLKIQDPTMFKTLIVDRKLRLLYCYVPKVASTNMRRLLITLQGKATNADAIVKFNRRGFEFLSDFNASERNHIIKTYFKFMFVRHPLERLVSAYRHRMIGKRTDLHERYGKPIVKKYRNLKNTSEPVYGDDVTFREFIKYLLDTSTRIMDNHWKPFFDICQPCLIRYDFIGSMEYLDFDVSALLEKLNAPKSLSFPKKQKGYQSLTQNEAFMYYRNLTHGELNRLRYKYKEDFKCFLYGREHQIRALPDKM